LYLFTYNNFDSASKYFKKALELEPNNSNILKYLGKSLYYSERYDESSVYLAQAFHSTHNPKLLKRIGDCYLRKKEYDSAMSLYTRYIEWRWMD
jgi:Tfp pilus assembly protein PilF